MFVVEVSGKSPSKFVSFFRSTQKRNFFAFQLLADGRRLTLREKKSVFFFNFPILSIKRRSKLFLSFYIIFFANQMDYFGEHKKAIEKSKSNKF